MMLFQWLKRFCAENQPPVVHVPDGPRTPPVRRRYHFSGTVQGVGFRYEAAMLAGQLDLVGWARNENDGTVIIEIEGEARCIDEFLRAMRAVRRFDITEIQTEELPVSGTETTFQALY
ncbi:MAG: acylphosphatase [Clostridiales bacterium]|nr:acylphosphatase [Clostridiales bacterium]